MRYKKIAEVTNVVTGGTPSTSKPEYWDGGTIPWLQSGCCQNCEVTFAEKYITQSGYDNSSAKMMVPDTVMIALTGATAGKVGYLTFAACGNQSITGILPSPSINSRFLFYYLLSKRDQILADCIGGAQPHISQGYVKDILIPDISLEEQSRIVDDLECISSILNKRQEEINLLDDLIKARFVELFGDLMENPLGWPVMTIADVSTFLKSGLSRKLSDDDIGLPVIRSGNIQDGRFIFDDVKYWYIDDPQGANTKDYILNDGDVLVNFINSSSQIGKTAIYRDTGRDCIYTTNIFRMKLADNCNEYYYNWFAMSDYYYRHLQSIIQPAVNQASFTTVNFLKLPIPLPPKEKQRKFADFVKQVDKSKSVIQKSLEETQLLFDCLMQEYFG